MKLKIYGLVLVLACLAVLPLTVHAQELSIATETVEVTSGGQVYPAYLSVPSEGGAHPAVILIHSFNGLEAGYKTMTDQLAARGFVVLSLEWQTFGQQPSDDTVKTLVEDSIAYLSSREDVDPARIGLTGFCAGGRYTMLLLPQVEGLAAGVAWYGFPDRGDPAPIALVDQLDAPMLIIHGTNDQPSPIAGIYSYATALQDAGATFELKVYSGEPHGFMLANGQLRTDEVAQDAFEQMADFFTRKLGA